MPQVTTTGATIVATTSGQVRGSQENNLHVFRGIPFAAPPIGDLRWRAPQPHPAWEGVRDATLFGCEAPQNPSGLDAIMGGASEPPARGEDCLYLNIWTPGSGDRRPVMFWIHGGGFTIGSGSQALYDGQYLAGEGDVVVVTINYRMGALGFLNLHDVTNGRIPATGNEGLLDQIAALQWVRDNIAAFGGDPENITIFGESAGGMSVGCLMAMPAASGLFHKAIPQSGACHTAMARETGVKIAETVLELLGTNDPDELMKMPESLLTEVQTKASALAVKRGLPGMSFQPTIDGDLLSDLPIKLVAAGSAKGIAVLTGSCRDEWRLFSALDPAQSKMSDDQLNEAVSAVFPDNCQAVIETYRNWLSARDKPASPADIASAIMTDKTFRLPAIRLLEAQSAHTSDTYCYMFDWTSPLMGGVLGACHAVELGFNWGTYDKNGAEGFFGAGPQADKLSSLTRACWLNFVKTGAPGGGDLPSWPAFNKTNALTMTLSVDPGVTENLDQDIVRLWEGNNNIGTL